MKRSGTLITTQQIATIATAVTPVVIDDLLINQN